MDQKEISNRDFGEQILSSLSKIFGYSKSTFWLMNPQDGVFFPVSYRVESSLIDKYARQFYKIDPFHPDNFIKRKTNENVISIKDMMSLDEYNASTYYKEFLGPTNLYYYETVIYLRFNGKIIGGIVLLRSKNEGEFNGTDINLMKIISTYISKLAASYMIVNDLRIQKSIFESFCNQSPIGLIIFEASHPHRIHYINPAAWKYTSELSIDNTKHNHAEQFIKQYVVNDSFTLQLGLSKTVFSHSLKKYSVNTVPSQTMNKNTYLIYVYIVLQNEPQGLNRYRFFQDNTNLTFRQQEIIGFVLNGYSNAEIAKKLFISVSTVKTHLNNIYKELNVTSRLRLYSKLIGDYES
jgi:DNA-binding CsgD family transcriptional regulator